MDEQIQIIISLEELKQTAEGRQGFIARASLVTKCGFTESRMGLFFKTFIKTEEELLNLLKEYLDFNKI